MYARTRTLFLLAKAIVAILAALLLLFWAREAGGAPPPGTLSVPGRASGPNFLRLATGDGAIVPGG